MWLNHRHDPASADVAPGDLLMHEMVRARLRPRGHSSRPVDRRRPVKRLWANDRYQTLTVTAALGRRELALAERQAAAVERIRSLAGDVQELGLGGGRATPRSRRNSARWTAYCVEPKARRRSTRRRERQAKPGENNGGDNKRRPLCNTLYCVEFAGGTKDSTTMPATKMAPSVASWAPGDTCAPMSTVGAVRAAIRPGPTAIRSRAASGWRRGRRGTPRSRRRPGTAVAVEGGVVVADHRASHARGEEDDAAEHTEEHVAEDIAAHSHGLRSPGASLSARSGPLVLAVEVQPPQRPRPGPGRAPPSMTSPAGTSSTLRPDADRHHRLPERDQHDEAVALDEVGGADTEPADVVRYGVVQCSDERERPQRPLDPPVGEPREQQAARGDEVGRARDWPSPARWCSASSRRNIPACTTVTIR